MITSYFWMLFEAALVLIDQCVGVPVSVQPHASAASQITTHHDAWVAVVISCDVPIDIPSIVHIVHCTS